MSWYTAFKLLHIFSAIVAVGMNLSYFHWLRVAKAGGPEAAVALDGVTVLDRIANVGYTVLPITGVAMVLVGDLGFSTLWIATAIALFIAVGAIAGIFFSPSLRRQVALAQEGGTATEDYAAVARRTMTTGTITMLMVAAIITLMVTKPG